MITKPQILRPGTPPINIPPWLSQMETSEGSFLLGKTDRSKDGLSVFTAVMCCVDVFGVFPLIALPKTIINCGAYGILVVAVVIPAQIYTSMLLGRSWIFARKLRPSLERKNRRPYVAISEFACGRKLSRFVTVLLNVTVFGGGIPNIIVAAQTLELLSQQVTNINLSYCYWMLAIGVVLCPILWLGSPKDMTLLCTVSVAVVIVVFALVMSCLVSSSSLTISQDQDDQTKSVFENILIAYGVITFQFDIHPSILTVQVDMKNQAKINHVILGGFGATLGMFAIILITVLTTQTSNIRDSLLESLPTSTGLHFAALLVAFQLALSSAISNSALYQYLEDCLRISREFNYKRCLLRTSLTLAAILLAESVPKFELVMSLIGGTLTGPLVFIFPPLFYVKMMRRENSALRSSMSEKIEILVCLLIASIGVCGTLATTYVNSASFLRYWSFSPPCVYNLTSLSK